MKYLTHGITALVFFYIAWNMRGCSIEPCPEIKESVDSTRGKLPPLIKETEKPKPIREYKKERPLFSEISKDTALIDTFFACNDIRVYLDTLADSSGTIISEDSVRGELLKKKVTFIPNFLTVRETNVIEFPTLMRSFYLGVEVGASHTGNFRLAPEIEYLDKKGNAFSYNYDVLNKVHSGGFKKRIF